MHPDNYPLALRSLGDFYCFWITTDLVHYKKKTLPKFVIDLAVNAPDSRFL